MENKFDKILFNFIKALISLLLILMFTIIIIGIFFRYIINIPIFGTEELARYIMFYMVMLGSAVAFREKKHPALLLNRHGSLLTLCCTMVKQGLVIPQK